MGKVSTWLFIVTTAFFCHEVLLSRSPMREAILLYIVLFCNVILFLFE